MPHKQLDNEDAGRQDNTGPIQPGTATAVFRREAGRLRRGCPAVDDGINISRYFQHQAVFPPEIRQQGDDGHRSGR